MSVLTCSQGIEDALGDLLAALLTDSEQPMRQLIDNLPNKLLISASMCLYGLCYWTLILDVNLHVPHDTSLVQVSSSVMNSADPVDEWDKNC